MKTITHKTTSTFRRRPARKLATRSTASVRPQPLRAELSRSEVRRIVLDILG